MIFLYLGCLNGAEGFKYTSIVSISIITVLSVSVAFHSKLPSEFVFLDWTLFKQMLCLLFACTLQKAVLVSVSFPSKNESVAH